MGLALAVFKHPVQPRFGVFPRGFFLTFSIALSTTSLGVRRIFRMASSNEKSGGSVGSLGPMFFDLLFFMLITFCPPPKIGGRVPVLVS